MKLVVCPALSLSGERVRRGLSFAVVRTTIPVTTSKNKYSNDLRHAKRGKELEKYARKNKRRIEDIPSKALERGVAGAIHSGICVVHIGAERRPCRPLAGLAVGDEVEVASHRVIRALPRRTVLSRPAPGNTRTESILAANVDLVIIVTSVVTPPFRPGLIDRVLVAVDRGGAQAAICVNKIDLLMNADDIPDTSLYRSLGVPVIFCSTVTGDGMSELRQLIQGKTCVFAGHSGVGKSSLINALCPGIDLATGEVGKKGRHTTSASCLHEETDGTRIIDTPGVREFGLWKIDAADLKDHFPEFELFAQDCRFSDCTHTHEPDCAVRQAAPPRYQRYLRMLSTIS